MSRLYPDLVPTIRSHPMPAWQSASRCVGGPRPGARALMAHWLESYDGIARSLGIYACRSVRGSSSRSVHAEGRACDLGTPVSREGHRVMYAYLALLLPQAGRLGIPYVIFDRHQWSARRPSAGAYYGGSHPHRDHAHVELTRNAGEKLTLATIRSAVGDFRGTDPMEAIMFCKRDDVESDAVRYLQRRLSRTLGVDLGTFGPDEDGVDGHYGGVTATGLGRALGRPGDVDVFGPIEAQQLELKIIKRVAAGSGGSGGLTQSDADRRYAHRSHTHNVTGTAD